MKKNDITLYKKYLNIFSTCIKLFYTLEDLKWHA